MEACPKTLKEAQVCAVADWRAAGVSPHDDVEADRRPESGEIPNARVRCGRALDPADEVPRPPDRLTHERLACPVRKPGAPDLLADVSEGPAGHPGSAVRPSLHGGHRLIVVPVHYLPVCERLPPGCTPGCATVTDPA